MEAQPLMGVERLGTAAALVLQGTHRPTGTAVAAGPCRPKVAALWPAAGRTVPNRVHRMGVLWTARVLRFPGRHHAADAENSPLYSN